MRDTNLIGKTFHKLTVISHCYKTGRTDYWKVQCECGKIKELSTGVLKKRKSCGCAQKNLFKDLSGKKYNKLTLIRCIGQNKYKSFIYEARCSCGKEIICEGNDVKTGRLKSCGCLKIEMSKKDANYEGTLYNILYCDYRIKARQRCLDFKISKEDFFKLAKDNCFFCNSVPKNVKKKYKDDKYIIYNGIDRLDNTKGYILSNCVSCCSLCNQAKHSMTVDKFKDWVMSLMKAIEEKKGIWV